MGNSEDGQTTMMRRRLIIGRGISEELLLLSKTVRASNSVLRSEGQVEAPHNLGLFTFHFLALVTMSILHSYDTMYA